jgi:hypothetical protein
MTPLPLLTRALLAVTAASLVSAIAAVPLISAFTILVIVLLSELIDLLVNVCIPSIVAMSPAAAPPTATPSN